MAGEGEASELDGQETARWQAVGSAVRALGESLASGQAIADDVAATFAQLRQIPLDHERILNAMHVPEDAEEYREALAIVLRRIPDGWGRWIGCDRGWYPIITELDAALAQLCPDYEVHQVKEKYGTLRYYAAPCGLHRDHEDDFDRLVDEAEEQSAITCEECGADGQLAENHRWFKTLCSACIEAEAGSGLGRYVPVEPRSS